MSSSQDLGFLRCHERKCSCSLREIFRLLSETSHLPVYRPTVGSAAHCFVFNGRNKCDVSTRSFDCFSFDWCIFNGRHYFTTYQSSLTREAYEYWRKLDIVEIRPDLSSIVRPHGWREYFTFKQSRTGGSRVFSGVKSDLQSLLPTSFYA